MNLPGSNSFVGKFFRDFLGKGHQRSLTVKKNVMASFVIRIISILISLVIVPLTIDYINPVQYGIWITLTSIIGWLGYFDVGLGNGLRNRFTEAVALGDHKLAKVYVSTTYAVLGIILFLLAVIFTVVNRYLNWSTILNAPDSMRPELGQLALIIIVLFCVQLFLQLLVTVLTANQEPAKASAFNLLAGLISLAVIFVLTKTTTGSLTKLGIALSITPVVVLTLSSIWFYAGKYRPYAPSLNCVDFKYIPKLIGLGIKFFFLQIATLILYQTSNLIIAHIAGSENVTLYNIGYKYFNIIPMFMLIIMMPMWSAITDAWTRKEITWITNTMKKLNYIWLALSVLVVVMLLFSNLAYVLWVGSDLHVPRAISITLAFSIIVNVGAYIYSIFLNGVGIIKLQLLIAIIGTTLFIPLAIFLGKKFGPPGVVSATAIVNLLNLSFFIIQYNKIIKSKATGIWAK